MAQWLWLIMIGGRGSPVGQTPDDGILCVFYRYDPVMLVPARIIGVVARLRRLSYPSSLLLLPCAPKPKPEPGSVCGAQRELTRETNYL